MRRVIAWFPAVIALILLASALSKVWDASAVHDDLLGVSMRADWGLSPAVAGILVRVAVALEIGVAILLLFVPTQHDGLIGALGLLVGYTAYLGVSIGTGGLAAQCACHPWSAGIPATHGVVRNAVLISLAFWALTAAPR